MDRGTGFSNLLQAAISGDESAILELIERYDFIVTCETNSFVAALSPLLSHRDVTQEIWFRVCRQLRDFNSGADDAARETKFKNWLRVTAKNVALNLLRNQQAIKRGRGIPHHDVTSHDVAGPDKTPSSVVRKDELLELLSGRVDELDETSRQILKLRFFDGMGIEDIAAAMDISGEAVRYRLAKTLDKLKKNVPG